MNRRSFLLSAAPAAWTAAAVAQAELMPAFAQSSLAPAATPAANGPITDRTVFVAGDAAPVSQGSYLATLTRAVAKHDLAADNYLKGGAVTELENTVATMLGKEDCCFLPTGTLANNLAVRILCGDHKHAIVQADSHLYADESDSASIMSGITLQPIAPGRAAPTIDDFTKAVEDAEHRAYPLKVGAISIESPVRRHDGESVPFATLERSVHWRRAKALRRTGTAHARSC